jgi:hypothetical protein
VLVLTVDSRTPCLTLLEGITFEPRVASVDRGYREVPSPNLTGSDKHPCRPHASVVSSQPQGENPRKCTNPTIHPGGAYLVSGLSPQRVVMEFDCWVWTLSTESPTIFSAWKARRIPLN